MIFIFLFLAFFVTLYHYHHQQDIIIMAWTARDHSQQRVEEIKANVKCDKASLLECFWAHNVAATGIVLKWDNLCYDSLHVIGGGVFVLLCCVCDDCTRIKCGGSFGANPKWVKIKAHFKQKINKCSENSVSFPIQINRWKSWIEIKCKNVINAE